LRKLRKSAAVFAGDTPRQFAHPPRELSHS
jgi:hypothetical protein